jgi:hypothetical protein
MRKGDMVVVKLPAGDRSATVQKKRKDLVWLYIEDLGIRVVKLQQIAA